jgi:hypothetical protein
VTDRLAEAFAFRDEARRILQLLIQKLPEDNYPAHILCSMELHFIQTWFLKRDELRKNLEALRKEIDAVVAKHKYSERLASLQKEIHGAYLEIAIQGQ